MQDRELSASTVSFGLSAAIVNIFNGLLVILKESNPDTLLAWMKAATSHHWITHGLIDLVLFVAIGFILSRTNGGKGPSVAANALIAILVLSVVVGYAIIAGFFLFED